jgi:hypothetical protein
MAKQKTIDIKIPLIVHDALDAWHVSAVARAVLLAMLSRYNGRNNGRIGFVCREGSAMGVSEDGTARAIHELIAEGFIWRSSKADEYRLNLHPMFWNS